MRKVSLLLSSLISQKHALLQELAPCIRRLPGFIGLVPPPALDKSVAYSVVHSGTLRFPSCFHSLWRYFNR